MKKTIGIISLAAIGLYASNVYSASFDCTKAKSFAEITICGNPELSSKDEDLSKEYKLAKDAFTDKKAFSEITKSLWSSRERCTDYHCIANWYDNSSAIYTAIANQGKENHINDPAKQERKVSKKDYSLYDSNARVAPVEHDSILFSNTPDAFEFIDTLVTMIRKSDYKCDSVSSFRPMITSNGYSVSCNKFNYKYEIKDNGGHITVSVDN
ncbi:lysozyme inhibitor LprI family protein [Yersinia enterocolitica]|uniref:lysozyme inhibitor LprI family protein n=1 Tax=Yersinia enterocolitica TaxID=630 RepID=UPI001E5B072F|nr:hypothetical protein [Yersinia enterocolitica]UNA05636.1 hypothetical protein vBYenM06161_070 [Yersinia phage vB_YenM_06.16-1]UNA05711.1 hypothetical protein vBYenM2109_072 [Yersinia phage vB_YenM_21.09]EKN5091898.1 hypothetical protein [Yersinia enterocolitica]ELI7908453.1 hypothetical protein [Yersinia enterocolitica]MCE3068310.1 hypothetical protein [Yersinia enterocolitica]